MNGDLDIVKVQWPLAGNCAPEILVYNESQTIMEQFPATPELKKVMGGKLKKYFYYQVVNKKIELLVKIKCPQEQDW